MTLKCFRVPLTRREERIAVGTVDIFAETRLDAERIAPQVARTPDFHFRNKEAKQRTELAVEVAGGGIEVHPEGLETAPRVGDRIYVEAGDDWNGGEAQVTALSLKVSGGDPTIFVRVKELPGVEFNWPLLHFVQPKLRERYAGQTACVERG